MLVKDRLKLFIASKGLTNQRFESEVGLSNGYVANMRKGVGNDALERISNKFPELNKSWLLTGEGNMLKEQSVSTNSENTNQQSDDMTIQKLLEALERKDKQINALLEQNSNLTAIISRFSGVSPLDDRISPPHTISVNTQDSER